MLRKGGMISTPAWILIFLVSGNYYYKKITILLFLQPIFFFQWVVIWIFRFYQYTSSEHRNNLYAILLPATTSHYVAFIPLTLGFETSHAVALMYHSLKFDYETSHAVALKHHSPNTSIQNITSCSCHVSLPSHAVALMYHSLKFDMKHL